MTGLVLTTAMCLATHAHAEPHLLLPFGARTAVAAALDGAARRLSRPPCRQVLSDFGDERGMNLAARLNELGRGPAEYLLALYFTDGDACPQCRNDPAIVAFTTPHSHVVFVCSARFTQRFWHNPRLAEVLLIHEMLHALGLPENPPSSLRITGQVWTRCAR